MYQILAKYYDDLVADEKATYAWADFIESHASFKSVLEFACGSGEITLELAKRGYQIKASDLSSEMICEAKKKSGSHNVDFFQHDMIQPIQVKVDLVLCLCDSMNYLIEEKDFKQVIQNSYHNLNENGTFIFDVHSLDRLEEFQEEFYEEGFIQNKAYEWSIQTQEDYILQNFVFFDEKAHPTLEQHIQKVYHPDMIKQWCEEIGFDVEIYTDFIHPGICTGEKYFYVCRRKS